MQVIGYTGRNLLRSTGQFSISPLLVCTLGYVIVEFAVAYSVSEDGCACARAHGRCPPMAVRARELTFYLVHSFN